MNDMLRTLVRQALEDVAPDLAGDELDPAVPIRRQVDFDSMDFLHLVQALQRATGIEIAERDYAKLASLDDFARHLVERGWSGAATPAEPRRQ